MTCSFYIERLRSAMQAQSFPAEEIESCCQYAQSLLCQNLPVLFDASHLCNILRLHDINWNAYHTFTLPQHGKLRTITAPSRPLKERQKWILQEILSHLKVSPWAHGFETGRSIKTNAVLHANHAYALCMDIQDFFPSISDQSVAAVFQNAGYSASVSRLLADLCCFQGSLPQGAPTSPKLSNILFRDLDEQLAMIAAEAQATYSRYADDLTFSSEHSLNDVFLQAEKILTASGFQLHPEKIHFYGPGSPKKITGLIVQNGMVRVPKRLKRALRQEIHYCTKYGVLTHLENTKSTHIIHYREYLYGKAYYIHMIEPEEGQRFLEKLDQILWPPNLLY